MENYIPISIIILLVLSIWDLIWRSQALWHSARNKNLPWFVALLLLNTVGILPILYLLTHKKSEK